VIGIGNEFRQDDGAGVAVARRLARHRPDRFAVVEHDGEATSLLEAWRGARTVVLVDAVRSGSPPGTIHRFDARAAGLPEDAAWSSTHSIGLPEAVALGRLLDRLPATLLVYGIEGARFGVGSGLSPEVDRAASMVVETLLGDRS
jgi:hydrogenase maturation protease